MTCRIARFLFLLMSLLPATAFAQSGSGATSPAPALSPAKIGILNIQYAVVTSEEGKKELNALDQKFAPTNNQLKSLGGEIEVLKKQLDAQGEKDDGARAELVNQIEAKQKSYNRLQEYAQSDYMEQQNAIAQKILQKLLPVVEKYAQQNGLNFVVDDSKQWPEWPFLWASPSVDITKPVLELYNAQSKLPAAPSSINPSHPPAR